MHSHRPCKAQTDGPPAAWTGVLEFLQLLARMAEGQQRLFSKTSNLQSLQGRAKEVWRVPLTSVAQPAASTSLLSEPATQTLSLPSAYFLLAPEDLKQTRHSPGLHLVNHREIRWPSAEMMFYFSKFIHFRTKSGATVHVRLGSSNRLTPSPLKSWRSHWQSSSELPSRYRRSHFLTVHVGPCSTF